MNERETLLANCLADPADDTARLVYADWLREQGLAGTQAIGRFVWAGVTLSRFRGNEPVGDAMFFDAQKELHAVGLNVLVTQLNQFLGWTGGEFAWDQGDEAPDRLTAVQIPQPLASTAAERRRRRSASRVTNPAATFERGMLCGLRLTLGRWREVAQQVLAACPLERVEVLDVPGLTFTLKPTANGWRLVGELKLPVQGAFTFTTGVARTIRHQTYVFPRWKLVLMLPRGIDEIARHLQSEAEGRWPRTRTWEASESLLDGLEPLPADAEGGA